ncbi:hypothetical protein [Cupriavidus metallidurans]|uniref:Uncharacterized protein n=1 Tax=Cupriavidus metallidurans TaxID=119219 RepID=A0A482INS0_9BURK|nr:hypothetical protein [Cupriavidus metallidurans]QBP09831.1 hypothetical protein DDF84_008690 [Cupriavidus metallidurans]
MLLMDQDRAHRAAGGSHTLEPTKVVPIPVFFRNSLIRSLDLREHAVSSYRQALSRWDVAMALASTAEAALLERATDPCLQAVRGGEFDCELCVIAIVNLKRTSALQLAALDGLMGEW